MAGAGHAGECLTCHTTGYNATTCTFSAEGITCAACHGDVNPDHPPAAVPLRSDTEYCGACHTPTHSEWRLSRWRRHEQALMVALGLVVMGVIVNRWNVTLSGLVVPPEWSPGVLGSVVAVSYSPTLIEVALSLGILGYALLFFTLGVRYLPIYREHF